MTAAESLRTFRTQDCTRRGCTKTAPGLQPAEISEVTDLSTRIALEPETVEWLSIERISWIKESEIPFIVEMEIDSQGPRAPACGGHEKIAAQFLVFVSPSQRLKESLGNSNGLRAIFVAEVSPNDTALGTGTCDDTAISY
jgi:hypothetical protein